MARTYNIAVFVGSLRKASYSRKIAHALESVASEDLKLKIVEIGDLPLYNEDLETATPPESWTRFRNELKNADGFLFVTPEYNRSIPATIKNAIDVGSRPYGQSHWNGKPGAVASLSQGSIGGFGANHHLRQSLVFCDVLTLQQPELYISQVQNLVTDDGKPANENARNFLSNFMQAFERLVKLAVK